MHALILATHKFLDTYHFRYSHSNRANEHNRVTEQLSNRANANQSKAIAIGTIGTQPQPNAIQPN